MGSEGVAHIGRREQGATPGPWAAALAGGVALAAVGRHHEPESMTTLGLLLVSLAWLLIHRRQRARAEGMTAALRTSESHVRAVLSAVPDGILALDGQGRVRSFSLAAEDIFGQAGGEAGGRPVAELLPGLAALEPGRRETWARHAAGHDLPVEAAVTEMHDGLRRGYVVVVRDISARRRSERERAAQHDATRALAESVAPDDALPRVLEALGTALGFDFGAAWLVDRGAGLLRPAACWVALPGTCERLAAETLALVLPPGRDLPGHVWQTGEQAWIGDLAVADSLVRRAAALAGGMRRAQACPITLAGEALGVLEFFGHEMLPPGPTQRDLLDGVGSQVAQFLERAAADRARRAAHERARAVIDNMLEGLVVSDADGRIEELNPATERVFGYGAWELQGQAVALLFEHELAGYPDRFAREAWLPALGTVSEWQARRKGGAVFPVSVALVEFHTAEGRRLLAAHVRDLSEERQAERTKKEFVATVSHELRTPLTSIRGALALLASGALGELADEAREVVEIAERNTARLSTLINDILDLERLESGRIEVRLEPVCLADVVERALESVSGLAAAAGVTLEVAAPRRRVRGDADRLTQVLVNLLANAVKFSPAGAPVRVECRSEGDHVEVRVSDQGRGIPREAQARLFERFQQVEASDAREKGGSGLGLAICRAIVALHHGQIGVQSVPGQGSTFWFRLPLADAPCGDGWLDVLAASSGSGPDVLLVEPDDELSSVVVRQFLSAGLPVRPVRDVEAAQAACRAQAPAVVVLDPGLPGSAELGPWMLARGLGARLVLYTSLDEVERLGLQVGPEVPVLTRSKESGQELASVVARLFRVARPCGQEVAS